LRRGWSFTHGQKPRFHLAVSSFHQRLEIDNIRGVIEDQALKCAFISGLVSVPEQNSIITVHSSNGSITEEADGFLNGFEATSVAQFSEEKPEINMGRGQGNIWKLAPYEGKIKLRLTVISSMPW